MLAHNLFIVRYDLYIHGKKLKGSGIIKTSNKRLYQRVCFSGNLITVGCKIRKISKVGVLVSQWSGHFEYLINFHEYLKVQ